MGLADRGACRAVPWAGGGPGTVPQAASGDTMLAPGAAVASMAVLAQPAAAQRAAPGHAGPPRPGGGVRRRGGGDAGACAIPPPRRVGGEARQSDGEPVGHGRSGPRAAPPARWALAAIVGPRAGRGAGRCVCGTCARRAARWGARGLRRLSPSRVARLVAGETEAGGSLPPRSQAASVCASIVACVAVPPWRAVMERAGPRTQGRPSSAPRAASPSQVHRHATAPTLPCRDGAMALRKGAGSVCRWRGTRLSPRWSRMPPSIIRACRALPPYKGCGVVENRLAVSSWFLTGFCLLSADHGGLLGRGPQ